MGFCEPHQRVAEVSNISKGRRHVQRNEGKFIVNIYCQTESWKGGSVTDTRKEDSAVMTIPLFCLR